MRKIVMLFLVLALAPLAAWAEEIIPCNDDSTMVTAMVDESGKEALTKVNVLGNRFDAFENRYGLDSKEIKGYLRQGAIDSSKNAEILKNIRTVVVDTRDNVQSLSGQVSRSFSTNIICFILLGIVLLAAFGAAGYFIRRDLRAAAAQRGGQLPPAAPPGTLATIRVTTANGNATITI